MIQLGRTTRHFAGALAGAALLLAVSGCTATPAATSSSGASVPSGPSATPVGSAPGSSTPNQVTAPAWTATGNMDGVRYRQTATLLPDGKVLVAGGFTNNASDPVASAELYDPSSGSWTATGNLITPRAGHTATLLPDGKVLVAGGSDTSAVAELYDPSSGSWTATGSMAGRASDSPTPPGTRLYHTATLLADGKVLVAGGSSFSLCPTCHALARTSSAREV